MIISSMSMDRGHNYDPAIHEILQTIKLEISIQVLGID